MADFDARCFVRTAARATGAVIEPGASVTLIENGVERHFKYSSVLTEQRVISFLNRHHISIHRDDHRRLVLFSVLGLGTLVILFLDWI